MGDEEAVATESPFHIIKAVERTSAKLRTCASDWRVLDMLDDRKDNMMGYAVSLQLIVYRWGRQEVRRFGCEDMRSKSNATMHSRDTR